MVVDEVDMTKTGHRNVFEDKLRASRRRINIQINKLFTHLFTNEPMSAYRNEQIKTNVNTINSILLDTISLLTIACRMDQAAGGISIKNSPLRKKTRVLYVDQTAFSVYFTPSVNESSKNFNSKDC